MEYKIGRPRWPSLIKTSGWTTLPRKNARRWPLTRSLSMSWRVPEVKPMARIRSRPVAPPICGSRSQRAGVVWRLSLVRLWPLVAGLPAHEHGKWLDGNLSYLMEGVRAGR